MCSIIAAGLATISFDGLFGKSGSDSTTQSYQDPNKDIISEQQTAVAEYPDDPQAIALLANLLGNTGRLKEAIPLYEKALSMLPDDVGIRLDFARALADGNLRPDAEAQFLELLKRDANNQQGHYYLAELYRSWVPQRTDEAIKEYRRVIAIDGTTYLAQQSQNQLVSLGAATPMASAGTNGTPTTESIP
ncbi:MAG: tetratricopeptide repeat protein [Thermomicrobiales bacterium]